MKALLVLLLAIAVGYIAYNHAYVPVLDALGIDRIRVEPKKEVAVVTPPPAPKVEPKPEIKPEPKPEPKPEMKPEAPPPPPAPVEKPKPKEGEFVPPHFDPVEVVTANWSAVPKGFFASPKPVKLLKEVQIAMKVGAGTAMQKIPAGGTAYALSQEGTMITVTPSVGSPGRVQVAMDDTDFKEVFIQAYEQVKVASTERARQAFEAKKIADAEPKKPSAVTVGSGSNPKPARDADGSYPLLLMSMKAGQVTEIKPDNVKNWGDAKQEKINKETFWTVVVKYETQTMFGKFETEAQARIKDGKVEKWVYVGSGEVVP
ncbi:MAG: hypothetical protein K1X78_02710 [Verrucomicrobiaceae bacterium]|nr:hypothetical protein [Verrucomicrobiaceae bacterium]